MNQPNENLESRLESQLVALRADLDHRATRDETFWQEQRRAIRRGRPEAATRRPARRRQAWALTALATLLLVSVVLGRWALTPSPVDLADGGYRLDESTAELLRSVENTLAADAAPALSAGDLLLAELEQEYLEQTTSESP